MDFQPLKIDEDVITDKITSLFEDMTAEYSLVRITAKGSENTREIFTGLITYDSKVDDISFSDNFFKTEE